MSFITLYLPRKLLSRFVGYLVHKPLPRSLTTAMISVFAAFYKIRLDEAEMAISEYPSLGEFFCRKLRPGLRPIAQGLAVHPCDSEIVQHGPIKASKLFQAKGMTYKLDQLTNDPKSLEKFDEGYFVTYYLCPTDYHRVHCPVDAEITHSFYTEGDLWPVNQWSLKSIPNLYPKNERVYVELATELGAVGVVFVGATNVGSIELSFDQSIKTNQNHGPRRQQISPPIEITKGSELGLFRMGSTVVVLYSKDFALKIKAEMLNNRFVKVGQAFLD